VLGRCYRPHVPVAYANEVMPYGFTAVPMDVGECYRPRVLAAVGAGSSVFCLSSQAA